MGEMAETFNAMKAHKKEQREARAMVNAETLRELGIPAVEQSKHVYRVNTPHGAVMYYTSSNTWQHKGKVGRGDVHAFKFWLTKRGLL